MIYTSYKPIFLFAIQYRTYQPFKLRKCTSVRRLAHFEFDAKNMSQKGGDRQQNAGKVSGLKKNSWVNWQQVRNMTECKRSILELQVNMVRGLSIYKKKVFKLWNNFRIDIVSEKL